MSKDFFETLIADEVGHIDFIETQLDLYGTIGDANYGTSGQVRKRS